MKKMTSYFPRKRKHVDDQERTESLSNGIASPAEQVTVPSNLTEEQPKTSSNSEACDADKSVPDTPFHPPTTFCFPKTKIGSRERSCQSTWFQKFPWLHYDTR